jgi:nucleoside-diphosphate-sugar epimerase
MIKNQERRCAITGTNGYLGSKLADAMSRAGWTVYHLTRRPSASNQNSGPAFPFDLLTGAPQGFFREHGIDALIHCAYDFRVNRWRDIVQRNVTGSVALLEAARAEGVTKIVYISSMSAFDGCKSLYGRAKLLVEKEAFRLGALVVRPGLVYGARPGAMVGALTHAIKSSPIVPLIGSGNQVLYPVHEDDLASLIVKVCADQEPLYDGPIIAAPEKGQTFRNILKIIAARNHRSVHLVPVPWRLFWAILKAAETAGLNLGFRSDSLLSLVNQDLNPDFDLTRKTGIQFRDFSA